MSQLTGSPGNPLGGATSTGSAGGGFGPPSFATIGTLTGQQQQIANLLQQNIGIHTGWNPMFPDQANVQGNALRQSLMSNPSASISPSATSKYINQSVATPLLRQYDQSIMPRLNDSYASVGALMGSRRGFANQQALQGLQTTIGTQMGQAQQQNMALSAQLQEQTAQRNAGTVAQQQANALGYNQLGAQLTGQPWMAIQPYLGGGGGGGGGGSNFGGLDMSGLKGPMGGTGAYTDGGYFNLNPSGSDDITGNLNVSSGDLGGSYDNLGYDDLA